MAGIGIVNNPLSRRNLRAPETARRLRALLDGEGEVADAATREELLRAVERFRTRGIDVLAVNGGDGTGHIVLTAFAEAYGSTPLPPVALLRGGAMNTVADAHKVRGSPESILKALLERRRSGAPVRTAERDLLSVEADGAPRRCGFLFGTGAVVTFLDAYYRTAYPRPATAAALLVRAVGSALVGGSFAAALTAREALRVTSDGDEWPDEPYLAVLAGAVPEIGFGFTPFSRCDEQPGFFHAVGVTGSTLQVAAHLPQIWLGRPWRRALAADAVARDLVIEGPVRFTIDGDLYEAREEVRIRTGPPVRLVVP
ncbi:MAG TPA: diacylglycerol kinase family protein [Anaeromyxobacteraceae bacterium]